MLNIINANANHYVVLAATTNKGATTFLETSVGKLFTAGLGAVGFLVVVVAIYKVMKKTLDTGFKTSELKTVIGAAILATFCFDPGLVGTLIDGFSTVVDPIASSIKEFISKGK